MGRTPSGAVLGDLRGIPVGVPRSSLLCRPDTACSTYTFLSYMCLVVLAEMAASPLLPLRGGAMRRGAVSKSSSVSQFKSRVGKTDKINTQRNRRGGIRL